MYGEQRDLPFFLYEKHLAAKFFAAHNRAKSMGVTADVMTRDSQASSGYWEIVQDALADLVRIMLKKCFDKKENPHLYAHCRGLRGQVWLCAFPNVFLTIAPAEWKFPRPYFLQPYVECVFAGAYAMAVHMYLLVRCIWGFLSNRFGHRFFVVYEWCCKTEYQGRKTPHWHIAAWVVPVGILRHLQGRTGTAVVSGFVRFLASVFCCEVDLQVGNGFLNYINGYVAKDHDAVDVGLGEYTQRNATTSWLATYRLLSKSSPGLPEVAIRMAHLSEFDRSYAHVLLYPPQPAAMLEFEGRQGNFTSHMYGFYLQEMRQLVAAGNAVWEAFLVWHRGKEYDPVEQAIRHRGGRHQQTHFRTEVVACRYWYELTDGFWGQFSLTQLPHQTASDLLPDASVPHLQCMQNFVGALHYLLSWRWGPRSGTVSTAKGFLFLVEALPLRISDDGAIMPLGEYACGGAVFASAAEAFRYLVAIASRDLQFRGMRDERVGTFLTKQEAWLLLYFRVIKCPDPHELAYLHQSWDHLVRPEYRDLQWSSKQREALSLIAKGVSLDDEEQRHNSRRWLYLGGAPGCGKTAVLLAAAIAACKHVGVLIVCPTGCLVHSFKARLPDIEGIENVSVDTIQGVLKYKRPGADSKVRWSPPSALRRIDLILIDEGSQYEDREWLRLFSCVREQPHMPFVCTGADFQQLQPVESGGACQRHCESMQRVDLDTVYRTSDPEHLLFLNRIRSEQPSRSVLEEYYGERHWATQSLEHCVRVGMDLARSSCQPFTWLTVTNKGASEVCHASLAVLGISLRDLSQGYLCDPSTKSDLRILAKPGILIRLSRNFDKRRGFVNGAMAEVCDSLQGNAVFTARLLGSNNMVLVHPMREDGQLFLPCCYGYALRTYVSFSPPPPLPSAVITTRVSSHCES